MPDQIVERFKYTSETLNAGRPTPEDIDKLSRGIAPVLGVQEIVVPFVPKNTADEGLAFAGGDVKDFVDNLPRIGILVKELTTYLHGAVSRLCRADKPVIMAVNGVAAGGGLSFALSGDVVVAAESARFTMAYSRIAATPDGSSSYFLPRLVGLRRALELYLTNRVLSAREALDWGLVTRVVPDAELGAAVGALARELAQGPSRAFGQAKRLFHQSTWESLETQMELEAQAIAASGQPALSERCRAASRRMARQPAAGVAPRARHAAPRINTAASRAGSQLAASSRRAANRPKSR